MKKAMIVVMLFAAVLMATPIAKNENNIQYVWNGLDFEVYQANVGIGGYRETALGADTLYLMFDILASAYDHAELYIEFTADAANGNFAATKTARNVALYWLPSMTYSARTNTAGNKLPLSDINSASVSTIEYAYRTVTLDSTSLANKVMFDNLCGRLGASTGVIGPFWIDGNAADSTGAGFMMITADTVGVSWRALLIPRT